MKRRVVITGLGAVSPLGSTVDITWNRLINAKSGIKSIKNFDTSRMSCKIAGLITRKHSYTSGINEDSLDLEANADVFDPEKYIDPRDIRKMDLFIQYGIAASVQAIVDSGLNPQTQVELDRIGVLIGSGIGGLQTIQDTSVKFFESAEYRVSPYFIPSALINLISGHVSKMYGYSGPNHSVVTACATGAHAIGDAFRMINYGDADVMIAGGAEAPITQIGLAGFAAAKTLSTKYNDTPELASRPWDLDRDGFVMGEGSGIVVLEEYNHAMNRGAKIYAELVGYALTGDAYHITSPHPSGRGALRAMTQALKDANISVGEINYINAHGTSTQMGDVIELNAVQELFLETNPKILMSSTKSSTGHLLGAAGSLELIFTTLAMRNSIVPPTLNLYNTIPEAKIDLVAHESRNVKIDYAMSNSFGFGGTNASLIIKKFGI